MQNKHSLGDQWNGEDLSIFSLHDLPLPLESNTPTPSASSSSLVGHASGTNTKNKNSDESTINPGNLKAKLKTPSISSKQTDSPSELTNNPGYRAAEAYVRPSPIATVGKILSYGFDLRYCTFEFRLHAGEAATDNTPTEIFLPEFHFPKDKCKVEVSAGKWTIGPSDEDGGMIQKLKWWHAEGEHSMKVTGIIRPQGMNVGNYDADGYYEQCQQSSRPCVLM